MKKNTTIFYIVRHGESLANVKRIVQGYSEGKGDTSLSDKGKKQSGDLAKFFENLEVDVIYSSDSKRAKETALIISTALHLPIHTSQELRERSFGKYEGMKADDFLAMYKDNFKKLSIQKKMEFQIDENEESNLHAVKRLTNFLKNIAQNNIGKTIIVITHGGIIRPFLIYNDMGDFDQIGGIVNCGYIKVLVHNSSFLVEETKGIKTWQEKHPTLLQN